MAEKIFISGLYSQEVSDKAPSFILGKGSIHVDKMIKWLEENRDLAGERGYINWTLLEGKTGTRYFEVDTWKPSQNIDTSNLLELAKKRQAEVTKQAEEDWKAKGHDDIPF